MLLALLFALSIPRICDLLHGNAPMTLYGMALDQNGNPAAAVTLRFEASAANRYQVPVPVPVQGYYVTWNAIATTGADGSFDLHDGWGQSLSLRDISGRGYEKACLFPTFAFGAGPAVYKRPTDPEHRAKFLCWNPEFKRILRGTITANLCGKKQGVSYRSAAISPNGTGDENFYLEVRRRQQRARAPFDWSIEVTGTSKRFGEIAPEIGMLRSAAPVAGYNRSAIFNMSASDPNWSREMTCQFYTRSGIEKTYAGVKLAVVLGNESDQAHVDVRYTANFSGSPDLTPGKLLDRPKTQNATTKGTEKGSPDKGPGECKPGRENGDG